MSRLDSRTALSDIRCLRLVICARQDVITSPGLSEELVVSVPNVELACVDYCNHYAPMERPYVTTSLPRQWLREV